MESRFSTCAATELAGLIERLDAEFIFGRGRSLSLAKRFPGLLAMTNLGNIFVARENGNVVASIAVKPFRWIAGDLEYAGAMIGMVWVDPARRGDGLGSQLLTHVNKMLVNSMDFAVLWTAQPGFYERSGWLAADSASFGETAGAGAGPRGGAVDFAPVRTIWQRQAQYAAREALWQPPLPLPAESLEMFHTDRAYAIAGRLGEHLYCHEMSGERSEFDAILERMRGSSRKVFFNERTGSQAYATLAACGVKWAPKALAMWLPLKRDVIDAARGWYVSWLDRI